VACRIQSLPQSLNLPEIKTLNLSANPINKFPESVFKYPTLENLKINSSSIRELPKEIDTLSNLQTLDLDKNKLSSGLPKGLG